MKINLTSVLVDDQEKALAFYTDVLGFTKHTDLPAGEFRFLTVVSPEAPDGVQLLLEPNDNPAAQTYQRALYEAGIPAASFGAEDVRAEYERMAGLGVTFTMEPTDAGWGVQAVFDDTCGNLSQLHGG